MSHTLLQALLQHGESIILGKPQQIRLALACILCGGHLLIEDIPGVGKTTLAQALAKLMGMGQRRVQFTSDLLPSDLLGVSIYDKQTQKFVFQPGPIFSHFLIADEINRSSPKTQSALLEAMAEGKVSIDGTSYQLPQPFTVIATQNPHHQAGTFALPESQLDRFLMRISIGYPEASYEKKLYQHSNTRDLLDGLEAMLSASQIIAWQSAIKHIAISEAIADYAFRLVSATRPGHFFAAGLSPRAGLALLSAGRAWAWMDGRDFVIPEDLQAIFKAVANHRLIRINDGQSISEQQLDGILQSVVI